MLEIIDVKKRKNRIENKRSKDRRESALMRVGSVRPSNIEETGYQTL